VADDAGVPVAGYAHLAVSVGSEGEVDALTARLRADGYAVLDGPRRTGDVPSIRGVGGTGVQIFLDGARQSFASGHDGRFFVDPSLLQAVEVVRGPSSALYGSGAMGGVIGLRTVDAADFLGGDGGFGARLSGSYESVSDQWTESGTAYFLSADGTLDFVGNVTGRQSSDIELGSGQDLQSEDDILSTFAKATWAVTEALTFEASWMRFHNEPLEPNNGQDMSATDEVNKDVTSETIQGTAYFTPDTNLVDFEASVYTSNQNVEEAETTSSRVVDREVDSWGFRALNRSSFELGQSNTVRFTYGGEYYVDEQTGRDNTTVDGARGGVPNAESNFTGLFAQAEFDFDRPLGAPGHLLVIPGVRYDSFESESVGNPSTDDDATSFKFGASYTPFDWFMVFGSYGESFRAPSFNEIYADEIHFPIILSSPPFIVFNTFIANPDLRPETADTWELGAGFDFTDVLSDGDALRIKGSYWWSDVQDLIGLDVQPNYACFVPPYTGCTDGGFSRYVNTQDAELDGVEIEAEYDSTLIYASASFAAIDGTDSMTGEYVGVLFPNRLNFDAGLYLPNIDGGRVGFRAEFADDFDEVNDPLEARDGYAVLDLYAVWEPEAGPFHGLRVDLGVDNVTDEDYERVFAGTSEPGRNYKVAIGWRTTF